MRRADSLGYVLNHVARQFAWALHEQIAPLGVVPGQFAQLLALYEHDGITQQELCDQVQIEQPTMAGTLARMERDGLITRSAHPTDGRKQLIWLTDEARDKEAALVAAAQTVNAVATQGLDDEQITQLLELLDALGTNLTRSHE